jgi:hypothetical protein
MKDVFKVNAENSMNFLQNLDYGSVVVAYDTPADRVFIVESIIVINEYMGMEVLREVSERSENGRIIEDVFRVFHMARGEDIPTLTIDDYNVRNYAKKAALTKEKIECQIDPKLIRMAKRTANANGVKFIVENGKHYFSGKDKSVSLSKQIESAYLKGDKSISFDKHDVSIPTIRCYTSNLASTYQKPFKCAVKGNLVTIYFKEQSRQDKIESKIETMFSELEDYGGIEWAYESFNKVFSKYSIIVKKDNNQVVSEVNKIVSENKEVINQGDVVRIIDILLEHFEDDVMDYVSFLAPEVTETQKAHYDEDSEHSEHKTTNELTNPFFDEKLGQPWTEQSEDDSEDEVIDGSHWIESDGSDLYSDIDSEPDSSTLNDFEEDENF